MKTDRLIRIDANLGPEYVARYCPDLCATTSYDFQLVTRSQQRELDGVVDAALASLDRIFDQVNSDVNVN